MLIINKKANADKGHAIATGRLISDATTRSFDSGKCLAKMCIQYGYEKGAIEKRGTGLLINCEGWGNMADIIGRLEKGDDVMVCGSFIKDDYLSAKHNMDCYKILVDFVLPMSMVGWYLDSLNKTPKQEDVFASPVVEDTDNPFTEKETAEQASFLTNDEDLPF